MAGGRWSVVGGRWSAFRWPVAGGAIVVGAALASAHVRWPLYDRVAGVPDGRGFPTWMGRAQGPPLRWPRQVAGIPALKHRATPTKPRSRG
jgi:hypothetical protein